MRILPAVACGGGFGLLAGAARAAAVGEYLMPLPLLLLLMFLTLVLVLVVVLLILLIRSRGGPQLDTAGEAAKCLRHLCCCCCCCD